MSETYIPSGEESAQEQQFLQALVGQIQPGQVNAVPKYATQLYCNFGGRYDTLAVNATMENATVGFSYPGLTNYTGLSVIIPSTIGYPSQVVGGLTAPTGGGGGPFFSRGPAYVAPSGDWAAPNPSQIISQTITSPYPYANTFPFLGFYRQSFVPTPIYILIPKWMRTLTVGMRLYDANGILQPTLIASKTNAKWQDVSVNSGTAPDGRYSVESIVATSNNAILAQVPSWYDLMWATVLGNLTSPSQWRIRNENTVISSVFESQQGGQSFVTLRMCYFPAIAFGPPGVYQFRIQYWTSAQNFDGAGGSVLTPPAFMNPIAPPGVKFSETPNATYSFSLPIPPSLPYTYYFRFWARQPPSTSDFVYSGTYAITYPAGYPTDPVTFTNMSASFDVIRLIVSNYAVVNPQPAGFATPPLGVPTFNSLDLSTMPLIATDITAPL